MNNLELNTNFFHCVSIHGVQVNCSSMVRALHEVETLISRNSGNYVCFFEANLFSRSLSDENVRNVINHAALIYPDGIAPALCAEYCSGVRFHRVSGPSFLLNACSYGIERNWRHFFLGGGEGVAEKMVKNLKEKYPGIQIAGTYCPPFRELTESEEMDIKHRIEDSHTDLLWVGLGGPKQEFWMRAHQGKINVPVMLGVGAAFDFHSGNRPWAPKLFRMFCIEWLWRMCSGGRKTLNRNLKCVSHISWVLVKDFIQYKLLRKKKNALSPKFG